MLCVRRISTTVFI